MFKKPLKLIPSLTLQKPPFNIKGTEKLLAFFLISTPCGEFCLIFKTIKRSTCAPGFSELYGHSAFNTVSLSKYIMCLYQGNQMQLAFPKHASAWPLRLFAQSQPVASGHQHNMIVWAPSSSAVPNFREKGLK